uniref:Uncharacterized sensor-like histidine kinase ycf26 n=1 Tax=Sciadococcus taiwanensis TaxID=3028030 RepID=A0A9Y1I285_9RHOD|nr:hypothetical protein SCTW_158 [Sciadococcus taiwanensis]
MFMKRFFSFKNWWRKFSLQTRLMLTATLIVSIVMSGITLWTVDSIQKDTKLNDTRFARDLGLLFAANVNPLVFEKQRSELAHLTERFYNSTASIRYIILLDDEGEIYYGIPFSAQEVQNSLQLKEYIQFKNLSHSFPLIKNSSNLDSTEIIDIFVPLKYLDKHLGFVIIGINPNPTLINFSNLTKEITIAVFVSIWLMLILGAAFNALTITQPIKELLVGVKNITAGNFGQRIDLPFGGELGELITSFNQMAERLEKYEKQNIEELTSEKVKLDTLVTTIADGAILLNPSLEIILANPIAQEIFRWNKNSIIGKNIEELLPLSMKTSLSPVFTFLLDIRENKEMRSFQQEFIFFSNQKEQKSIRIFLTRVFDQSQTKIQGIAVTIQDVTKEAELNQAKSQFISNVSHELRTPLFNIKSFIETLEDYEESLSKEQRREFLQTANKETNRLTRLVNDVLDLSRLESGNQYNDDYIEITQIISEILRSYQISAQYKNIRLSTEVENNLPLLKINYDLIMQILANLISNAIKFTYLNGSIVIRVFTINRALLNNKKSKLRIEISDNGVGIDKKDYLIIFDRFSRIENQVHILEGTGLGLSIVQNILERYKSKMFLNSELGIGSTFWFDLLL